MEKVILIEKNQGWMKITIHRPDKLNALNASVLQGLQEALHDLHNDASMRGCIITGAGEKAFVAGADISTFVKADRNIGKELAELGQQLFFSIERSPKPIIAAVNGYALGGGCELALACHFRIASDNARFGQPEVNLGIIPGYGGSQRLTRLIGKGRALEWMMTGDSYDAQEALRIGLVNHVCPASELQTFAETKMRTIISKSTTALAQIIAATNASEVGVEEGMKTEAACFGTAFASDDMLEGTTAFLEKRKPQFK
ncbi:MAG: enoyl-CoA hydratase/isomerase family protein [Bacteroidota bacterium]